MKNFQIRIGLVGFGSMGRTHLWSVLNLPFLYGIRIGEVVGVCTTDLVRSERICSDFGISTAYSDASQMIADSSIDVIDICTPNNSHFPILSKALTSSKSVLCEKPLCFSAEEAREIARLSAASPRTCGMVFNNRWLAPVIRAKELIASGDLGKILHFSASYLHNSCLDPSRTVGWKQDKTICGGGVLPDLGSHLIDLMSFLCGRFRSVGGMEQIAFPTHKKSDGTVWNTNAEEAFFLRAQTEQGAYGTLTVSKISQGTNDDLSFEIYGENGSLRFSLMNPNWLEYYDASAPANARGFTRIECVGRYPEMIFPSPKAPAGWLYGHLASMHAFLTAVAEEKAFSPSLSDGVYVQYVMDAAYRSAKKNGIMTEVCPCL